MLLWFHSSVWQGQVCKFSPFFSIVIKSKKLLIWGIMKYTQSCFLNFKLNQKHLQVSSYPHLFCRQKDLVQFIRRNSLLFPQTTKEVESGSHSCFDYHNRKMPLSNLSYRCYAAVCCTLIHLILLFFISNKKNNVHSTRILRFKRSFMCANIRETSIINWEAGNSEMISDLVLYLRHQNLNCRV